MKRYGQSILCILLTCALLCALPWSASAADAAGDEPEAFGTVEVFSEGGTLNVIYRDDNGNILDPSSPKETVTQAGESNLPSSYDLRTQNRVTGVRNQNPAGTCWAFGAIGATESNMISKGYASASSLAFSEDHLIWYTFHMSEQLGDGAVSVASGSAHNSPYNAGGYWITPAFTLVNWWGAELAANAPYMSGYNNTGYYKEAQRTASHAHLQNVRLIAGSHADTLSRMDTIKRSLMENGACAISYFSDADSYRNGAHYQTIEQVRTNHTVTLIGWDDSFSKNNFLSSSGTRPPADGAWLVKNSWGSGSAHTQNGYTWLSYYDPAVLGVHSFDVERTDNYDNIHTYNGFMPEFRSPVTTTSMQYANVFTAPDAEVLQAVGLWVMQEDVRYTIRIYRGLSAGATDPTGGSLVSGCTVTGVADLEGYYTIPLNETVRLAKNERYAVVVSIEAQSHSVLYLPFEGVDWNYPTQSVPIPITYSSGKGESFYNYGSVWKDASANALNNALINTYTQNVTETAEPYVRFTPAQVDLLVGESATVYAVSNQTAASWSANIAGVKSFCSVAATADGGIQITANAPGSGVIRGSINVDGQTYTADLPVTVTQASGTLTGISIQTMPNKTTYQIGESFNKTGLSVTASYSGGKTADVTSKCTLSGFSSAAAGTKTITVTYTEGGVSKTASFTVTVSPGGSVEGGVTFSPSSVNLQVGEKASVRVSIPSGGSFSLSEGNISSICSVGMAFTQSGVTLEITALNKGSGTVSCTSVSGGVSYTGTLPITVTDRTDKSDYTYSVENNEATITGYTGTASALNIPAAIDGYTVTAIGERAIWKSAKDITQTVVIPDTVRSIGSNAFTQCSKLKSVQLPASLKTIGSAAFSTCTALQSISIPSGVQSIGKQAFDQCTALQNVQFNIGDTQLTLESFVFLRCTALKTIDIASSNIVIGNKALGYSYDFDSDTYSSTGLTIRGYSGSPAHAYYLANSDSVRWANLGKALDSIEVVQKPSKTVYQIGESFSSTGLRVAAHYSDGSEQDVTSACTLSGFSSAASGSVQITVRYTEGGVTRTAVFTVSVTDSSADPLFSMAHVSCAPGKTVQVPVTVSNNPGICMALLSVSYDRQLLELVSAENGSVLPNGFLAGGDVSAVPYSVLWNSSTDASSANGTLVIFTFKVKESAAAGTKAAITLQYDYDSTRNIQLNPVWFRTEDGSITVGSPRMAGDVNGDGKVTLIDAALISRFVVGGWGVTLNESAADVNGDSKVTLIDAALISRYVVGGWGVVLK